MYTGYYISEGHIYGVNGYTKSWIDDSGYIYKIGEGNTSYYIKDNYIYSFANGGYSQFYIDDNYIYGPSKSLPWM